MVEIKPNITKGTLEKWQRVVDLIAELANVPASLIMNTNGLSHSVFVRNTSENNPYVKGRTYSLHEKLYCFGVFQNDGELTVKDATCDPRWQDNEDLEHGMTFYIGYPVKWPDGELFGTICVLDRRQNKRALMFRKGLKEFCKVVEDDLAMLLEVKNRKTTQNKLEKTLETLEDTVAKRTKDLEDANTALRVLLKNVEAAKSEVETQILRQIKELILPHISKLRYLDANQSLQSSYLEMIEANLKNITTPLSSQMAKVLEILTPAEVEIAQMILLGRTTKEIARTLSRGTSTIDFHRNNIRQKIGLHDRRMNLQQYLLSLS